MTLEQQRAPWRTSTSRRFPRRSEVQGPLWLDGPEAPVLIRTAGLCQAVHFVARARRTSSMRCSITWRSSSNASTKPSPMSHSLRAGAGRGSFPISLAHSRGAGVASGMPGCPNPNWAWTGEWTPTHEQPPAGLHRAPTGSHDPCRPLARQGSRRRRGGGRPPPGAFRKLDEYDQGPAGYRSFFARWKEHLAQVPLAPSSPRRGCGGG